MGALREFRDVEGLYRLLRLEFGQVLQRPFDGK